MLKQLFVSIVVLVVAAAGYVYFVPGSDAMLRNMGVNVPFRTAYSVGDVPAAAPTASGRSSAQGAPGAGRPGGFGGRQTPTVITAAVTTSTIDSRLTAIGQGSADQSVSVTSQATGTLVRLAVAPGATVKAGDLIGQLDDEAEKIAYDKAQLAEKDASDALQRTQTLAKTNAATTVQLSTARLALDNADLELRNAKLALDKRSIVTPIGGTVGLFQVTAGNAVGAQTVVTTVDDTTSILVNFWVPERYAPAVKVGLPVSAKAIALPDRALDGKVSAIDSRVDPTSRTMQVQAQIPNLSGNIKPGMSFEVTMAFPGETYPAVDPLAIQWGSDGSYVWLLGADSKVHQDKVAIIQRSSDGVLVKGDLEPGQQVVTQGVLLLTEGAAVRRLGDSAAAGADAAPGGPPAKSGNSPGAPATETPAGRPGNGTGQPAKSGAGTPS
ncbi:MAG: efflux RND transporter periplasmic adaptor subunit [Devosia sp.]|nr:efflux RND transporter periplasmic adaptor subunit [Devosia sp.]